MSNSRVTCDKRKDSIKCNKNKLLKSSEVVKKQVDELKKTIYFYDIQNEQVSNSNPITFMSLDKNNFQITINEYAILIPRIIPYNAYDKRCNFKSSDVSIAEVKGGVVLPKKCGTVYVTVTTANNEFQDVATINIVETVIEDEINLNQIYKVDLSKWSISNVGDNAEATSRGINNMLIWAKNNNYRKVIMEPGTYLIDENNTIYMVSNLELDLNGATLKLNPSSLNNVVQINIKNVSNSKITNGIIEGDRYNHGVTSHEFVHGIQFDSCSNIEISNLTIKDIQGYGLSFAPGTRKNLIYISRDNITKDIDNKNWKTINKIDISKIEDIFSISDPFGYGGYKYISKYVTFDIYFYNEKEELIDSYYNKKPYFKYGKPKLAKYIDITFNNSEWISDKGNTDFGNSIFFITDYNYTEKVNIHDCIIENCLALGCAYSAYGDGNIIENCKFKNNGGQHASYDFDAEDGWDNMSQLILKNNIFESYNSIVLCAGDSITMINNTTKGAVYIYGRCTNTRLISNTFTQETNTIASITANSEYDGDIYFEDNIIKSNFKYMDSYYPGTIRSYMVNNLIDRAGIMSKFCTDMIMCNSNNKYVEGDVINLYMSNCNNIMLRWLNLDKSILNNCSIISLDDNVTISKALFINCRGVNLYNSKSKMSFKECVFINSSYFKADENENLIFENCKWFLDIPKKIAENISNIIAYYENTKGVLWKSILFSELINNKAEYTIIANINSSGNGQAYIVNIDDSFNIERRWDYFLVYSIVGKVGENVKKYMWTSDIKYDSNFYITVTNKNNTMKIYINDKLINELVYDENLMYDFQNNVAKFGSVYNSYFEKYLVLDKALDIDEIIDTINIIK